MRSDKPVRPRFENGDLKSCNGKAASVALSLEWIECHARSCSGPHPCSSNVLHLSICALCHGPVPVKTGGFIWYRKWADGICRSNV